MCAVSLTVEYFVANEVTRVQFSDSASCARMAEWLLQRSRKPRPSGHLGSIPSPGVPKPPIIL